MEAPDQLEDTRACQVKDDGAVDLGNGSRSSKWVVTGRRI